MFGEIVLKTSSFFLRKKCNNFMFFITIVETSGSRPKVKIIIVYGLPFYCNHVFVFHSTTCNVTNIFRKRFFLHQFSSVSFRWIAKRNRIDWANFKYTYRMNKWHFLYCTSNIPIDLSVLKLPNNKMKLVIDQKSVIYW